MSDYLYVFPQDPGHLTCTLLQSHGDDVSAGQTSTNHHDSLVSMAYSRWAWDSTKLNPKWNGSLNRKNDEAKSMKEC